MDYTSDANTRSHRQCMRIDGNRLGDCSAYSFGDSQRDRFVASGENDNELFASVSSNRIVRPQYGTHVPCGLTQDRVSCAVTIGVIDTFEVIQIYHREAKRMLLAQSALDLSRKPVHDCSAIENSGQCIQRRLCLLYTSDAA